MIVVVEGVSASGKTAWCTQYDAAHVVPEMGRVSGAPDPQSNPVAAAAFWAEQNAQRWQEALIAERETGLAVCDTDPLKIHYAWCLWQVGKISEKQWRHALEATRKTVSEGRVGFAEIYFVKKIEPQIARQQRDRDPTRSRRNFELHLSLQPPLIAWYEALGAALPGRVQFSLPPHPITVTKPERAALRYNVDLFDLAISLLPRIGAG